MGHSRPLFLYFVFSIQLTVYNVQYKFCRDSNRGHLVSEATALPTEPQPFPYLKNVSAANLATRVDFLSYRRQNTQNLSLSLQSAILKNARKDN